MSSATYGNHFMGVSIQFLCDQAAQGTHRPLVPAPYPAGRALKVRFYKGARVQTRALRRQSNAFTFNS